MLSQTTIIRVALKYIHPVSVDPLLPTCDLRPGAAVHKVGRPLKHGADDHDVFALTRVREWRDPQHRLHRDDDLDVRDPARRVPHSRGVLRAVFDTRQPIAYVTSGAQDFALCEEPVLRKRFESYRRPSLLRGKGPSVLAALYTATVAMDPSLRTLFWRYFWTFPPELQGDLVAAIRKDVTTVAGLRKSLPRRLAGLVLVAEEAHIASTKDTDTFVCRSHFRLRDALAARLTLIPRPWSQPRTRRAPSQPLCRNLGQNKRRRLYQQCLHRTFIPGLHVGLRPPTPGPRALQPKALGVGSCVSVRGPRHFVMGGDW